MSTYIMYDVYLNNFKYQDFRKEFWFERCRDWLNLLSEKETHLKMHLIVLKDVSDPVFPTIQGWFFHRKILWSYQLNTRFMRGSVAIRGLKTGILQLSLMRKRELGEAACF